MTRTKATVKRRQQRSRLEREAQKAQLREAREAEQQQRAQEEEEEEVAAAPQQNAENQEEQGEREEDRALVEVHIRENAREAEAAEEEERQQLERALAEQPIKAQEANAREQEGEREDEGHEEGKEEEEDEEEQEGDGNGHVVEGQLLLTDYEKQRERRLKENAAKLVALNLPALASSFGPPMRLQRQSSTKKSKKDDDYMPSSSSDSEDSDSDDNNEEGASPRSQQDADGDYNEDQALQEAIALSLTATADNVTGTRSKVSETRKGKRQVSERNGGAKKRRKGRQEQFTSDEIAAIFSLIDERGNGKFSVAELERIARSHDFTWSMQEISDMIDIFDSNKDGQLDLSEFQGIFGRMNMLKMHVA